MTSIIRVKTRWTGFAGAPGFTVMHFRDFGTGDGGGGDVTQASAEAAAIRVNTFFESIRTLLPQAVRVAVEPEVDVIEDTNDELVNSFSAAGLPTHAGTQPSGYSASTGAVINWRTGGVRNGRRVRGRTFLVPLSSASYDFDGDLLAESRTTIQSAADALANAGGTPDLGVYARPSSATATDGAWFVVNSASVPSMLAVLRSRRD